MKKLSKLVLGSFVGPFLATFFLMLFILVMQFIWLYVDDFMGKGLEWYIILELLIYATANLVPLAMPLAILLASIMTLGNLAENYELAALKSAGLSLFRIMRPLIITVVCLSGFILFFTNNISPIANLKFKSLLWDITEKKPALELKDNVFYDDIEGYSIRVRKKNTDTQELYDVLIYEHDKKNRGNYKVIRAERGKMSKSPNNESLMLTLYNGHSYDEQTKNTRTKSDFPLVKTAFEKQEIMLNLEGFGLSRTNEDLFKTNYSMLTIGQLIKAEDSLYNKLQKKEQDYTSYFKRSIPLFDTTGKKIAVFESHDTIVKYSKSDFTNFLYLLENQLKSAKGYSERARNDMKNRKKTYYKFMTARHKKLVFSFSCIALFFIGGPMGAIIKKGGLGMPVVVSVIFFLVFHILFMTGEKMSKSAAILPIVGMWMNMIVLTPISIFLSYKANADSSLFDSAFYSKWVKKIFFPLRKS